MCYFEIPTLLLYTYVPTLAAGLLIGFFVFFSNKKSAVNINLFAFILVFCFWNIIQIFSWLTYNPESNLFLERLATLVTLSLLFFLYFVYALTKVKLPLKNKILISIPFYPIAVFIFSDYNIYITNRETCDVQNGWLYWYIYLIAIAYTVWSIKMLIKYKKDHENEENKSKQLRVVIGAILFVVCWFLLFVLARSILLMQGFSWGDNVFLLMPIGMLVFIGLLTYAITQYKLFNIKLLAAQALVVALVILIGSMFFFANSTTNYILIGITLVLSVGFGYMLVKSVKLEVERKEELQLMSNKLAQANDQLRKLDNSKSEFISIASHQLRTPLTAIKGFVSLLLEGAYGKLMDKQEDALNKTYSSTERLINLVEDLLNVSRMESGRMEFKFAPTDMTILCQEIIDTFVLRAKQKNMYLEYKKPEAHIPELLIDAGKVKEVVSNMVDNALKYTPKGGVTLKLSQEGDQVRVTVSDTGIGIPATELPYLFNKFSRGKDVGRLNTGGTGLGLYVGKGMIENNGGRIWAESDGENKGSRFIIELPIKQSEELLQRWG